MRGLKALSCPIYLIIMSNDFYIISTNSYIKNVSKYLDMNFLKELKTSSNELKPHIKDLDINATYYGKKCIKASIPTCFVEIEYKTPNGDRYMINYDCFIYEEDYPTLESLEAYQKATSYAFASQVSQEVIDLIESFHNGYGCECLSSGDY